MRWLLLLLLATAPAAELLPSGELDAMLARGEQMLEEGEHANAVVQLSLALRQARTSGEPEAIADAAVALGRAFRAVGRHREAIEKFEEAEALDRKSGRVAAQAADRLELGTEAWLLGDLPGAHKGFERSFRLYQDAGEALGAADALNNLGLVRWEAWNLDGAQTAIEAAITLFEAGGDASGAGDAWTNLGLVFGDRGDYALAIEAFRTALDSFDRAEDPAGRMEALHDLGNLHAELGDLDRAGMLYLQATDLAESPEQIAATNQAMGTLLLAAGELDSGTTFLKAALEASQSPADKAGILLNLGEAASMAGDKGAAGLFAEAGEAATEAGDRPTACAALLAQGEELLDGGEAKKAGPLFDRARKLADALELPELRWRSRHGQGLVARARGKDAAPLFREAVTLLEEGRRGLEGLDAYAARRFVSARGDVYQDLIDALLSAGDGASALLYAERLRMAELDGGGAADEREQGYRALERRQSSLESALREAEAAPESRRDAERIAALRAELAEARVAFSRFVDELRTTYPDFDRLVRVDPSDIEAWQRDLGEGELVLQPVVLPDRLVLLAFSSGPLVFKEVPVSQAELEKRIGRVLRTMRSRRLSKPEKLQEHLDALGAWLWAPVADEVSQAKTVIVVPAGPLRYLPFQLLRHEGRYLVQDHPVVNLTNVGSLKRREGDALRFSGPGLLALGNPDGSLPAADAEVDAVAGLFPGATVLHGEQATRAKLAELARGRSVVHLATHGVLDATAPERSYIVLAKDEGDGHLGYLDIPGLYDPLQDTDLVVLSACETAVPLSPTEEDRVQGTGLEIAGLANQFRRAGVPRLLASLWQVSDESTQALMVRFYQALGEGRTPPEALATAQRALLAKAETGHPFHWAPFVLVGTPR